ncbi:MAG: holo-ACP synthase [Clostridia bacterium]|nr:holo-ACP synthase [Clostridia bacterium]
MIIGIGTDIVEVARIEKAIKRSERFIQKLFTSSEIEYFESRSMLATTVAGNFAAKEAVSKVFGTGLRGFEWTDIEVLRDALGKPCVTLYGGAKQIAEKLGITEIMVSISHCDTYAVAYCVGTHQQREGDEGNEISH